MSNRLQERANFWRAEAFQQMEMLHATFIKHVFPRHYHDTYAIGMIERNAYTFYHQGAVHLIQAGEIVVINPGEIHTGEAMDSSGWTYRMFYPSLAWMREIAQEITGHAWDMPHFEGSVIGDPTIAGMIRDLHRMAQNGADTFAQQTASRLAFGTLIERYAVNMPLVRASLSHQDERAIVRRAREYMQANLAQPITLHDLAAVGHVSPYHLAKVFKDATGLPPHKYLTNLRVMRARHMLRSGASISDVAAATGFTDQSHLTRWFKRVTGITPGQYARL